MSTSPQTSRLAGGGPCPPPERLAAFIDGRLQGEEHARVLAHLGSCERCREVFVLSAEVLDELPTNEPAAPLPFVPAARQPARAVHRWLWLAAAVPLLLASALWWLLGVSSEAPSAMVARLAAARGEGPAPEPWNKVMRGPEASPPTITTRFQRLGVQWADLTLALRRNDGVAARLVAEDLPAKTQAASSWLEAARALESLTQRLSDSGDKLSPAELSAMRRGLARLEPQLLEEGGDDFRLGAWLETARLAAESHDREFLRSAHTQRALQHLIDSPELAGDDTLLEELRGIAPQLRGDLSGKQLDGLATSCGNLLRNLLASS